MGTFFGPSITVIFFPLFLSLPSVLDFFFLLVPKERVVRRREQTTAVWSSSCCLPDQRGNKRGLPS